MKNLFAIPALFLAAAACAAEEGLIFARTLRENAEIKAQSGALKSGETASANGAEISAENGFASFALSNFSACLLFSGKIKIEKFEQDAAQSARAKNFSEKSASELLISAGEAVAVFARGEARPASKFKISTKFGIFEPKGGNIKIEIGKDGARVIACDAAINYYKPGSQTPEYVPIGCELVFSEENGEIKISRKQLGAKEKIALKDAVSAAADAFKTSEFYKDENGKARARRIALKEFFTRTPQNKQ